MRKTSKLLLACTLLFCVCSAFVACADNDYVSVELCDSSDGRIVIEALETGGDLADALVALQNAGLISFDGTTGDYGLYVTAINGKEADSTRNEYWAVYCTLGEYDGVEYSNIEYGSYEWEGVAFASASYGVSGLPIIKGEKYIIVFENYQ